MEPKARTYYEAEIRKRDLEISELKKERLVQLRTIGNLKSQILHWKALAEAVRAEFDAPALFPETERLRELFPRFPFIHLSQQRILLILWDFREKHGEEVFLSTRSIHSELYSHRPAKQRPRLPTINVFIHHLRRALQGTKLSIESKHMEGWRLRIHDLPPELSTPESENISIPS